ncbi:MAG: VWA domain-containing protein, partial [Fuerstia sp.]|nr:VWA domain-containing protein [Fuerstiella sp.]
LDDLDSGTNVDIWDHKIAKDMRALVEIFAEVVSENQIVAPSARLYAADGQVIKNFSDGLPARVTFALPSDSSYFELEVGGEKIRQAVK